MSRSTKDQRGGHPWRRKRTGRHMSELLGGCSCCTNHTGKYPRTRTKRDWFKEDYNE